MRQTEVLFWPGLFSITQIVTKKLWDLPWVLPREGQRTFHSVWNSNGKRNEAIFQLYLNLTHFSVFSFSTPVTIIFIRLYDQGEKHGWTYIRLVTWVPLAGRCYGRRWKAGEGVILERKRGGKKDATSESLTACKHFCMDILFPD